MTLWERRRRMVQVDSQQSAADYAIQSPREMYMILYPKELEDEIIDTLESAGVPGYTEMPKMVGRGRHVKHFDNPVWPGATGCVFTVVAPDEARSHMLPAFQALAPNPETRSKAPDGRHIFRL